MKIEANNVAIEVEDTGGTGTPVLLIMGLGMQLVAWPPQMVDALVQAGYRVIRFDNRDIGLSQKFEHLGKPNLLWAGLKHRMGWTIKPPYTLHDMAQDSLGVLDALGIAQAHIIGASMGGMIAQRVALQAPQRVLSLNSIMSSSGARELPPAQPQVMRALFKRPASADLDAVVNHYVNLLGIIGSPGFAIDPVLLRERLTASIQRSYYPPGTMRQMVAIAADTGRAQELASLRSPTLVLHGHADPLVPFAHGQDTARRISGARLVGIEGMGHDLAPGVVARLLQEIIPFIRHAHHA
jgi:pimeloyl-ACP methyl ester carboxylesterase